MAQFQQGPPTLKTPRSPSPHGSRLALECTLQPVREDATDDELYAWFIRALGAGGVAEELEDGRIRVQWEGEEEVHVLITRAQLRSVSYTEHDVFDDTDPEVIPRTATPVATGLDAFTFYADETLATRRRGERYLVFHRGRLQASRRAELPPARRPAEW